MTAKTTLRLDALAALDERVTMAQQRVQSLAQTVGEHAQTVAQIKEQRIHAYSADDEDSARRLKARTTKAEAQAVELGERHMGAEVAARRAQAERDAYVCEHHAALVAERAPSARAIAQRIEDAIGELGEAVAAWTAEGQVQAALLRTTGANTAGIPDLSIRQLARELQRAARDGVVAPLPDSAQVKDADPEPEPEPAGDLRDGARAVLRARREAKPDPDDDARPMIEQIG